MRGLPLLIIIFLALPSLGRAAGTDDHVVRIATDDQEMLAAFAKARRSVDGVIALIKAGTLSSCNIKVQVHDGNGTEYFWLSGVTLAGDTFTGRIDNDPEIVKNVKIGDVQTVAKTGIYDWMYMKDRKMHGNYTLRVLLKKMDRDEAAKYRALLAPE